MMQLRHVSDDPNAERWMTRALIHAWTVGRYGARPNPMVGCVLARGDELLASGAHRTWGEEHAERVCLHAIDGRVPSDATLYVSLEPCSHHGRQPPCTDLIIERGVRRVVIGSSDPNPETSGIGPRRLADAGIEVSWLDGRVAQRALELNRGFQRVHRLGRPDMFVKFAMTRNGRFATGDPDTRWISSPAARAEVQQMRAASSAIVVGVGTIIADDPALTVRDVALPAHAEPWRVICDRTLRTPPSARVFDDVDRVPVLICASTGASQRRRRALEQRGARVEELPPGDAFLPAVMQLLARNRLHDVLVEAGPTLVNALYDAQLIDRVRCYRSPVDGSDDQPGLSTSHPMIVQLQHVRDIGGDAVLEADLHPMVKP